MSPGDLVGEYRIEGPLGHGGFGEVFSAVHPVIGKHVAIKVLKREAAADQDAVTRFTAEAAAVNRIAHPSIVDVFGFGQTADGRHYYVMELLRGESLARRLEAGPLALADALPILRGIAVALDAAHDAGFVHRDLKPENVFLVGDEVKLIDFGLAKLVGAQSPEGPSRAGQIFGTPHYMAPEQCRGRAVNRATDIYAVGVLAFEMLTGRVPFDAADAIDVLLRHVHDEPPRPSSIVALPAEVDAAIAAMLAKNPDHRPQNASAAVALLERLPSSRSYWWIAIPVAAGAIALAVVATLQPWPSNGLAPDREVTAPTGAVVVTPPTDAIVVVAPGDARTGVLVRVDSNVQAEVWREGARRGMTPFDLVADRGELVNIELRSAGRITKPVLVDTKRDHTIMVELVVAQPPRSPGPDDIEVPGAR